MPYNPFDKPIGTPLTIDDLQLLISRSVSEGYFVEYKSQMQTTEKIAKSIAALANTYGGWYFVGIEADKTHNVATNICGFSLATCADPIATVREVARSRISPAPIFYSQVVKITHDLMVLVIYVPDEQNTPFITSDGKIYRRVADSSHPESEKDRYAVDRLFDRQRQHAKKFERFFQNSPTQISNDQLAWLTLVLSPYPSGLIDRYSVLYPENAEQLFLRSQQPIDLYLGEKVIGNTTLAFTSVQPTNNSLVLRQVLPSHVAFYSLTLELFIDGSAKFQIPIPLANLATISREIENFKSAYAKEALQRFINAESAYLIQFFNIGQLWKAMYALLGFYLHWLESDISLIPDIKFAFHLQNVRRCVPFLDMDEWGTHINRFGLPILFMDAVNVPDEPGKGYIHPVEANGRDLWSILGKEIGLASGLSGNLITAAILNSLLDIQNIPPDWLVTGSTP